MRFRCWKALARGVLLEALRRKDLWVVAILGFIIIASAGALGFFGISGLEVFAKDLAFTVLGMFSTIIAVITASRILPEEIKNRTLYPLLARPISRFDLLIGKLLGAIVVTWIAFLILAALTALALAMFHVRFEWIMAQYVLGKMLGLAVLCSVSLALSTVMTPPAAATMGFVLAFGSSMIVRALVLAYDSSSPIMQVVFKFLNYCLPQFQLFDFGGRAANIGWPAVPAWVIGVLAAYAVVYSAAMVALSWAKFRKQAV
jgi:ABC-type transport system involved in multi-copper enzyme maturation permease subunit